MSTSLAEQLKRFTVPQTTRLLRDKKRPSLLFDPKEAANLDRDTVYEIGIGGLQELQKCNYLFQTFEHNLFSLHSKGFERSVENSEANIKLDEQIRKFLLFLSPYFPLKCAHKALEWLINRYHIQEYNKEDLLMLILPYHETNIFVRCLQLIELKENDRWIWLKPLQRPGIHLPKSTLYNHCANDAYFLNFLCRLTSETIKVHENPNLLTVVYNFYCTTIVGGLEYTKSVDETQVSQILPCVLKGLSSTVADFVAATYVIVAKLVVKIRLSEKLLNKFVNKIVDVQCNALRTEAALLVLIVYQSQEHFKCISSRAVTTLAKKKWLPAVVEKLRTSGSHILPFLQPLVYKIFAMVLNGDGTTVSDVRDLMDSLLDEVKLEDSFVDVVIRNLLESYDPKQHQSDEHTDWFRGIFKRLENGNPVAFDNTIQKILKTGTLNDSTNFRKRLKRLLELNLCGTNFEIIEKIYHPNPKFRVEALTFLIRKMQTLSVNDLELLKTTFVERLKDDNPEVVIETLNLCKGIIVDLLDSNDLVEALNSLLVKCLYKVERNWQLVIQPVLNILCSEPMHSKVANNWNVFFTLVPYLLPSKKENVKFCVQIVKSFYGANIPFIDKPKVDTKMLPSVVSHLVLSSVSASLSTYQDLLPSVLEICGREKSNIHKYLSIIFMSYLLPNTSLEVSYPLIEVNLKLLQQSEYVALNDSGVETLFDTWTSACRKHKLPLQGLLLTLQALLNNSEITGLVQMETYDLSTDTITNKFLLTFFDHCLTNCCNPKYNKENNYTELFDKFLNKICQNYQEKILFLSNLSICKTDFKTDSLDLRCLRLLNTLLSKYSFEIINNASLRKFLIPALMVSLVKQQSDIRTVAFGCIVNILLKFGDSAPCFDVLQELLKYKEEILLDSEQLPLILYSILLNSTYKSDLEVYVEMASDQNYPKYFTASILEILQHINSYEIFSKSSIVASNLLKCLSKSESAMDNTSSEIIYRNILRLSAETAGGIKLNSNVWNFIETALKEDALRLTDIDDKYVNPSILVLNQIDRDIFNKFNANVQKELLNVVVTLASETQNPEVISLINRMMKKIELNAEHIFPHLVKMRDVQSLKETNTKRKRRVTLIPSADILDYLDWRKGVTVLEFIQDKKKIFNTVQLLPVLFNVLKKCLDFDEQATVEYPKQLLLSSILNSCNKMSDAEKAELSEAVFNMELVVQCVRASQNPQTHHHALLVLAQAANLIPQQVLHHIMAIFTFMGSSVLRHDDAYSFQIISKIIDTVIPLLVEKNNFDSVSCVLRVFVDALLDIPEHRRMPLFEQLLTRINAQEYLWLFLLLVFGSHVVRGNEDKHLLPLAKVRGIQAAEIIQKRLNVAASLARLFAPEIIIENCIKIVDYLRKLPEEKEEAMDVDVTSSIFNIQLHTAKQFRHYKYIIVTFTSQLLSSKEFVTQIAQLRNEDMLKMEDMFKKLVINVLRYIQMVSKTTDKNSNSPQAQYWKVMLHHSYDILDSTNALLTCQMFLLVIRGLMVHNIATVRRRALELLNTKLQYQAAFFENQDNEELFALLQPLLSIIKSIDSDTVEPDNELIQQTALLSLKLIVRLKAQSNPTQFVPILNFITELIRSEKAQGNILAALVLCLAELCTNLRAHSISNLAKFMPAIIKVMRNQRNVDAPNLLLLSVITAVQKILNSLPLFLSPYLEKLLCEISILTSKFCVDKDDPKLEHFVTKLNSIKQKIGSVIPPRVLIPAVGSSYSATIEKKRFHCVKPLMSILEENLNHLLPCDVISLLSDLTSFFLVALQFRADGNVSHDQANVVETYVINAFSTFILKLSETSFRPLYYRLFDWAVRSDVKNERVITFYSLSSKLANSLKGLFVLFAGHFLPNAATLLDSCNDIKNDEMYFEGTSKNVLLVENILQTLQAVFLYDSQKFINKERFGILMQSLVDQLENTLDGEDNLHLRAHKYVIPCIVQFAIATADDALWQQMNYQILLKTRHTSSNIRLIALKCLEELTNELGRDFMPLLPETIPFLAEMLEDEEESVEKATQKAIQKMEKVLGEPLSKYF